MNKRMAPYYWMTVPAVVLFFVFMTLPALQGFIIPLRTITGLEKAMISLVSKLFQPVSGRQCRQCLLVYIQVCHRGNYSDQYSKPAHCTRAECQDQVPQLFPRHLLPSEHPECIDRGLHI